MLQKVNCLQVRWQDWSGFLQMNSSLVTSERPTPPISARSSDSFPGSFRPIKVVLSLKLRKWVVLQSSLRPWPFLRASLHSRLVVEARFPITYFYIGCVQYIDFWRVGKRNPRGQDNVAGAKIMALWLSASPELSFYPNKTSEIIEREDRVLNDFTRRAAARSTKFGTQMWEEKPSKGTTRSTCLWILTINSSSSPVSNLLKTFQMCRSLQIYI